MTADNSKSGDFHWPLRQGSPARVPPKLWPAGPGAALRATPLPCWGPRC